MLILAIESSCDETACAVVSMDENKREILSNIIASSVETQALYGGVVPEIASRAHIEAISNTCRMAIKEANISLSQIEAIGVTYSPGLIGCLLVGVNFAKALAFSLNVPIIPVNHIKSHTAAAYFSNPTLKAPFLSLVVSGGHTSLYKVTEPHTFIEIGSTRDDAAGEAFDKVGRVMGLPYPGGAAMDALARIGFERRKAGLVPGEKKLKFPSPAIAGDTLDFSFSGLKTAVVNHIHNYRQKANLSDKEPILYEDMAEIAAAFTESAVNGICLKLEKAIAETGYYTVVLAGGVAANSHLRCAVEKSCKALNATLTLPEIKLCGDNGAMVGAQTYYEYTAGIHASTDLNAYASDEFLNISVNN